MGNAFSRYRHRRAAARQQGRRRSDLLDCADCLSCADCSPFLLSPVLLLLRVVPGAFQDAAVDPWVARPGSLPARAAARLVRSYQLNVSAPRARPVCSMTPTCSRYALQALSRHGLWRGGLLVLGRLRRCGSAARTGGSVDRVPPAR
jgi:putative component of membrane protein insertase Oxa1/YidC/SpoIIIJ protein YidD